MDAMTRVPSPRAARPLGWLVVLLLAVRFSSSTALVDVNLSPPTLVTVGAVLAAYEVLLALSLLAIVFVLLGWRPAPVPFQTSVAFLGLLGVSLVVWLLAVLGVFASVTTAAFLILGTASVAAASWIAHSFLASRRDAMRPWSRLAFAALLVLVPIVFAMRVAALEGLDPVTGSAGTLRGNWIFVNVPTILLEFLALAVFVNVLFDRSKPELRRRWYAFLPFLLVPLILDAITDRPLTGYILSALVTWGSDLALFSPALASLGLLTAVVAAFACMLLLLGRRGNSEAWDLLLIGVVSTVFAGFYPSMASVAGLAAAMLFLAMAIVAWPPART